MAWRQGAQAHHQHKQPPAPLPYRTAPGAELVVAAAHSIPPQEMNKLGKASKSGSWRFDPDMIIEAMSNLREQSDRQQEEIQALNQARETELELKEAAETARLAAEAKAEKEKTEADRTSARLRSWLALALTIIGLCGAGFAYLAPRLH